MRYSPYTIRHVLLLFALMIVARPFVMGQRIHLFTSDNDLSSSLIQKVLYDSRGFLWVATEDGLNRFDGSRFTVYRNIPGDSTSLADNFVNVLFEDDKGNLLVGTYQGVQVYNPELDCFTPRDTDPRSAPVHRSIGDISQKSDGLIVLGASLLVEAALMPSKSFRVAQVLQSDSVMEVRKVVVDNHDNIWYITNKPGVGCVSSDGKSHIYMAEPKDPQARSLAVAHDGTLYAGTQGNGLWRFDPETDSFVKAAHVDAPISCLLPADGNNMYVGTDGQGLKVYDTSHKKIMPAPFNDRSSDHLKVHALARDEYDNLWIGSYQKGLYVVPAQVNAFQNLGTRSVHPLLIGDACATAVMPESDGTLWIGTDNDGIYRVSPSRTESRHFPGSSSFPAVITKFYVARDGKLWVSSYDKGVGTIDRATGAYHRLDLHDDQGRPLDHVFDIVEDNNGRMYIAVMGTGLFVKDGDDSPRLIPSSGIYNPWITAMKYDKSNDKLYFGTYDGIFVTDGENIRQLLNMKITTSICVDHDASAIWGATTQGLVRIDKSTGEIQIADDPTGSLMIHAVESDGTNLWLSTNSGLYRYDPKTHALVNFNYADGIQGNEFYKGASYADSGGLIYFGGTNGVTYFDPKDVNDFKKPGEIRVNRFFVGANEIKAGDFASGSVPVTTKAIFDTDTFRLASSDMVFSLDFNVRDPFAHPAPVFLYSLDGGKWQEIPLQDIGSFRAGSRLTFSHLPAGTHTLSIKANDKGAESDIRTVTIIIEPAWYATTWAKVLYAIFVLSIVAVFVIIWRIRQRRKISDLQRKHEEEVKEGKLQFFTNVSHEIKTPMSLVIGPVEQLISDDEDPDRRRVYRTILRNSKRILRLVNEIMDLRKIDKSQLQMKYSRVHMVGFIDDLYCTFEPAASKKGISLTFNHEGCDNLEADIDYVNFDKVVMNLLSNAIKYTPKGGSVVIDLSVIESADGERVRLAVTDTGIGVPPAERERIFERFYRVADNYVGGTGIGLHLSSRLMALHHGRLWVEDNPDGQGSRFIAEWPLRTPEKVEYTQINDVDKENILELNIADTESPEEDDDAGVAAKRSAPLVYIVEDDREISAYLAHQLGAIYNVRLFENGQLALEAIHSQQPDLVISDVMMPVMDGLTLTRKIRDNIKLNHIPVLLLTAKTTEQDYVEGYQCGADDYIAKPFSINILLEKVKSLISSHARLKNVYSGMQDQAAKVEAPQVVSHDDKLLERVLKIVNSNLGNSEITIEMIAQEIGISRVHLHRKLKELTNQTTRDFIRNIRLQKAAEIMQTTRLNVSEVSDMVGFKNPNTFSALFKEMFGCTPSQYMDKHHNNTKNMN